MAHAETAQTAAKTGQTTQPHLVAASSASAADLALCEAALFTVAELAKVTAELYSASTQPLPYTKSQQQITPRTIRYYQTQKILDPPTRIGSQSYYKLRHLLQLLTVKIYQLPPHALTLPQIARQGVSHKADQDLYMPVTQYFGSIESIIAAFVRHDQTRLSRISWSTANEPESTEQVVASFGAPTDEALPQKDVIAIPTTVARKATTHPTPQPNWDASQHPTRRPEHTTSSPTAFSATLGSITLRIDRQDPLSTSEVGRVYEALVALNAELELLQTVEGAS